MSLHRVVKHPEYVEGCFGCKASTLSYQNMHIRAVSHANDKELNAYRSARKHGIQPKTTKLKDINAAVRASDTLGRAVKA
jgi:protoporphyrinogen oxidase